MKGPTSGNWPRYTGSMETVVLVLLAVVVTLVGVDAIGRLDERAHRRNQDPEAQEHQDDSPSSTQKIVVDLSKRS